MDWTSFARSVERARTDAFAMRETSTDAERAMCDAFIASCTAAGDYARTRASRPFLHVIPGDNACNHEFDGWREFEGGCGGEQVCTKCGMGAAQHSLRQDDIVPAKREKSS